jgi:hypothetical protein
MFNGYSVVEVVLYSTITLCTPNLRTDVQTVIIPLHLRIVLSLFLCDYTRGIDW